MISKTLRYLHRRPLLNLLLLSLYFPLVALPHELVGQAIGRFVESYLTWESYNAITLGIFAAIFFAYIFWLYRNVRGHAPLRNLIAFYLAALLLMTIVWYKMLIVVNIEAIHFVQYAIFALLLFPLVRRYGETIVWIVLAGALDEAYQHFLLAPVKSHYFDFNDVVINLLGGVYGLLLARSVQPQFILPPRYRFWRSPAFYAVMAMAGFVAISLRQGWLFMHASANGVAAQWSFIRVEQQGFWTTVHPNITFHAIQPMEGLIIIGCLCLFFSGLAIETQAALEKRSLAESANSLFISP